MSFKTDRLAALFPDVYASRERDSLLHRVLDALGAELVRADTSVKNLLKSHWIDYATGGGLDGLGALIGATRRRLPRGALEDDDTFRALLKATVPSFVGGGTVAAVQGAVRAALGLPYSLELYQKQQTGPSGTPSPSLLELVAGLRGLVQIVEFSPKSELIVGHAEPAVGGSEAVLEASFATVQSVAPRIEWTFAAGWGRGLSLLREDTGEGIACKSTFEVPEGATLVVAGEGASFSASIGTREVSSAFTAIDGVSPPRLPAVPAGSSRWIFRAGGAEFDRARFDQGESFDAPAFVVKMEWTRFQPLTFDVVVPYFVDAAVQSILARSGFEKRFKLFQGLSRDAIQRVVDQRRAAGVRGAVQYSLALPGESHDARPWDDQGMADDVFHGSVEARAADQHEVLEGLTLGALDSTLELHDAAEAFSIGGVFNVSVFDGSFSFQ